MDDLRELQGDLAVAGEPRLERDPHRGEEVLADRDVGRREDARTALVASAFCSAGSETKIASTLWPATIGGIVLIGVST